MSAVVTLPTSPATPPAGPLHRRMAWPAHHNPKRELWLAWWAMLVFYNAFFPVFFIVRKFNPRRSPLGISGRRCTGSRSVTLGYRLVSASSSPSAE